MEIVDYASPTMKAETALKEMHWAMLENDFDKAMEFALSAITETKLAYHAIKIQKERAEELAQKANR
jgi:hypothetical protein